jgi:hypothetical protein
MGAFQTIETWTNPDDVPSIQNRTHDSDKQNARWVDERTRTDIVKLLIIDASFNDGRLEDSCDLDTLLLLAHHPQVNFRDYMNTCLQCCNIGCGIYRLSEFALKYLIYFGLLEKIIDDAETRLVDIRSELPESRAYMTLVTMRRLVGQLTSGHDFLAETVPFRIAWATQRTEADHYTVRTALKTDVISDKDRLPAMTKHMWKVLIIADLLIRESDCTIEWEAEVLSSLDQLFLRKKIMGKRWVEYELDRWPLYLVHLDTTSEADSLHDSVIA